MSNNIGSVRTLNISEIQSSDFKSFTTVLTNLALTARNSDRQTEKYEDRQFFFMLDREGYEIFQDILLNKKEDLAIQPFKPSNGLKLRRFKGITFENGNLIEISFYYSPKNGKFITNYEPNPNFYYDDILDVEWVGPFAVTDILNVLNEGLPQQEK